MIQRQLSSERVVQDVQQQIAELLDMKEREERLLQVDLEKLRKEQAELESQQPATTRLRPSTGGTQESSVPPGASQVEQAGQAASSDSKRAPSAPSQSRDTEPLQYRKVLAECPKCGFQNKLAHAECPGCVTDCPDGFTRSTNLVCGWDQARRPTVATDPLTFGLGSTENLPR